ncbi:hypothetical protein L3X38_026526 [Prunus dulcis]|uniref:Uncharacterized protein n=1 Tax=Prunus dulcis TaxID=3755 RepID=A0AAD4YZI5_PRUDU|nr:hypothetical protein L3X38_026526 [Prunus dulcis]
MRPTSASVEWIFLATYLVLEILSAACDQASSPRRPHFAIFGMLLAIAAVFISIGELIYRVAGISQCICSIVQYVYCLRHADSPLKASLLPAIFLICLIGSRLSNKRMNANIEQQEQEQLWQRQLGEPQEQEQLLQRMNANTTDNMDSSKNSSR